MTSFKYTPDEIGELNRTIDRLRTALKPFAEVGRPFIAAAANGAFPAGASARFMKLEPLTAQEFIDAAKAYEQNAPAADGTPLSADRSPAEQPVKARHIYEDVK